VTAPEVPCEMGGDGSASNRNEAGSVARSGRDPRWLRALGSRQRFGGSRRLECGSRNFPGASSWRARLPSAQRAWCGQRGGREITEWRAIMGHLRTLRVKTPGVCRWFPWMSAPAEIRAVRT
jgi:hypothetical protein